MGLLSVHNEWDPLEEVIVGRVENARIPRRDKGLYAVEYLDLGHPDKILSGPYPTQCVEETAEDLERIVEAFQKLGIVVQRPEVFDHARTFATPDWESDGMFNYCPRDIFLAVGETLIETPNVLRARQFESLAYKPLLREYFNNGARWLSAPRPQLLDSVYQTEPAKGFAVDETEPMFDAANVLRFGRDLVYLVSDSGNYAGAKWLQSTLGPGYRVHAFANLRNTVHIDTTLMPVRPGLMIVNGRYVTPSNLPSIFKKWDIIYFNDVVEMGYVGIPSSSNWVGVNFLMITPSLAMVDERQKPLIDALQSRRVEVLPLRLRHSRTLGGGFHCVTLDVRRRGTLESYCD